MTTRTVTERQARDACLAEGNSNPDMIIKGKPLWHQYLTKTKVAEADTLPDPIDANAKSLFSEIQRLGCERAALDKQIESALKKLTPLIKGKRCRYSGAIYVLGDYFHAWGGRVEGKGRKITQTGKLGSQSWDVRRIDLASFE